MARPDPGNASRDDRVVREGFCIINGAKQKARPKGVYLKER